MAEDMTENTKVAIVGKVKAVIDDFCIGSLHKDQINELTKRMSEVAHGIHQSATLVIKELTAEQKKDYVDNQGAVCPHCGTEHIYGNKERDNEWVAWEGSLERQMECGDCHQKWLDRYELRTIYTHTKPG